MSSKKRNRSNSRNSKRDSLQKRPLSKGQRVGTNRSDATKQHLSLSSILLISLPVLAVFALVAWFSIDWGSGDGDSNDDSQNSIVVDGGNIAPIDRETRSSSSWASRDEAVRNAWKTGDDQARLWDEIDNAETDGWNTEVISDRVTAHFNNLKKLIVSEKPIKGSAVASMTQPEATVDSLIPVNVITAFADDHLTIRRGVFDPNGETSAQSDDTAHSGNGNEPTDATDESLVGADALAHALQGVLEPFIDRETLKLKLKVFRVTVQEDPQSVKTLQTLELYGPTQTGVREENAVWEALWSNEEVPKLQRLQVVSYEAVDLLDGPLFSDCTESVFGNLSSFRQQLLIGYDYWLDRSQTNTPFVLLGNNGIAVADINQDGLDDLYICQEAGLPNLLYLQNPDGTLQDVSSESGVDLLQNTSTALFVDINNNGIKDLLVALTGGVVVAEGAGDGTFTIRETIDTNDNIWSLTAVDYDRDGWLDFYVGTYSADGATNVAANVVITDDDGEFVAGGTNSLYRNTSFENEFSFHDVTEEVGLMTNNFRYTFAAAWEDYDNDGDQDLYVANDFGWNNLYRCDVQPDGTVRFVDVAAETNAEDDSFGMSVNWADYDRDGWMDVYISNMYSYAGNRITTQDNFKSDAPEEVKQRFQRYARGNTLLRNLGGDPTGATPETLESASGSFLGFEDTSVQSAVNMGRWAWGSIFIDFNNNGWDDIFVNNGYITSEDTGDL